MIKRDSVVLTINRPAPADMFKGLQHTEIPFRDSGVYDLPPAAFKLYCWLLTHENGYKFTRYYINKGISGMDYRTIKTNLIILRNSGIITISKDTISILPISKFTISNVTNTIGNNTNTIGNNTNTTISKDTKEIDNTIDKKIDNVKIDNVINSNIGEKILDFQISKITDQELYSIFFGEENNIKMVNFYLSNKLKSELTYHQFEKLFILSFKRFYEKQLKKDGMDTSITREDLIHCLNNNFVDCINDVLPTMEVNVKLIKENEDKLMNQLQQFKL